jgi:uncharacterized membrane protein
LSQLFLALIAFILLHSVPALPPVRNGAIAIFGRKTYLLIYSVVSTLLLVWVFHAALNTPYVELWGPSGSHATATLVLAPIGIFLVLAGLFTPNPASITFRHGDRPGALVAVTRHPVLWGFLFWSGGHVIANGDLRSLILFGGLGLFSAAGFLMLDRRAKRRLGQGWSTFCADHPLLPLATFATGRKRIKVDAPMALAFALTAAMTLWLLLGGHALLFGADPLSMATI